MIRPTLAPSISRFLRQYKTLPSVSRIIITRSLVSRAPGSDPLDLLRHECMSRQLCDQNGNRLPGVHWVCAIAVSAPDIAAVSFAYAFFECHCCYFIAVVQLTFPCLSLEFAKFFTASQFTNRWHSTLVACWHWLYSQSNISDRQAASDRTGHCLFAHTGSLFARRIGWTMAWRRDLPYLVLGW